MTNKNDNRINLKNDRKMVLPKRREASVKKEPAFFRTSIRLPADTQLVMLDIDKKFFDLTGKRMRDQDKWHVAIRLLNKMLEFANSSELTANTDLFTYLDMIIEEKFDT